MNAGPLRAAVAIFVLGALVVWLVTPIGNPCPDLGQLPPGSTSGSAPSFTPPLTRTCTYRTPEATEARSRYVPWLDWLVLALVAGVAAAGVRVASTAGGGARPERPPPLRAARPRPVRAARPRPARGPPAGDRTQERGADERERARRERAERARRERGGRP
jgi:hypothetical protein